jgi:hypothetical protein
MENLLFKALLNTIVVDSEGLVRSMDVTVSQSHPPHFLITCIQMFFSYFSAIFPELYRHTEIFFWIVLFLCNSFEIIVLLESLIFDQY